MSAIPSRSPRKTPFFANKDVTALVPDFPFHYGNYLTAARAAGTPLCRVPSSRWGEKVLIVGAGVAGLVAAYEVLRMGLHPIVVEASERIGGRLYSKVMGDPGTEVICELGAMRFPVSGKALFHYFDKVGMSAQATDFPNPGTAAAVSTVIDYQGSIKYYEHNSSQFPIPPEYVELEDQFFGDFLGGAPFHFEEIEQAMTEGSIDQPAIKRLWNAIVKRDNGSSWDDASFYQALLQESGWSKAQINLFGQIGFGTGGWNTDYPNSILEVLRVLYTGLDASHQLMHQGADALPKALWSRSPTSLGDACDNGQGDRSVESMTREVFADPFGLEVRHVSPLPSGEFSVLMHDLKRDVQVWYTVGQVVYTPHVRVLDKLRAAGTQQQLQRMDTLLPKATWEAVKYTHYMQSAKIFAATRTPFWNDRPGEGQERPMSVTLSDSLTRGTYLVDYSASTGAYRGSGIFLSYTWNDDALKFLGDQASPQHAALCTTLLQGIYPNVNFSQQYSASNTFVELNWEDQPHYLGAFKMNLPGQYEYQRRLFSQFMDGVDVPGATPCGFVLAGDDVSWTGGWAEGAVTSAINAVNKIAVCLGGASGALNPGPVDAWSELKPIELT
ncbi:flavin monoamine oxidase family protein [Pseudomonas aegrilactucae]|uniref:Tryptophan 2-monooxygenase n=1 Tax=Pseudomonas aegrilactucae TaxID=2854028 RepID=A0A9Q2XS40_9PSED|nr:NAD(P)/FAD-dependent oxidoreductase [Pseudomonas aegrilactucae]MBV6290472.1 FAD-dependent oxidoreductase [Pseudomonas aegrilactucae]